VLSRHLNWSSVDQREFTGRKYFGASRKKNKRLYKRSVPAHSSDDTQMPEQPRDARDAVKAWKATTLKTIGFLDKLHMHIDKLTKDFDELKSENERLRIKSKVDNAYAKHWDSQYNKLDRAWNGRQQKRLRSDSESESKHVKRAVRAKGGKK